MNVLQILSEPAAVSLAYGYYREDLPDEDEAPRNVVFVDCGHSSLQVWVCAFSEGNLKVGHYIDIFFVILQHSMKKIANYVQTRIAVLYAMYFLGDQFSSVYRDS